MASVQMRVHEDMHEQIENTKWEVKYKLRIDIQNAEILNALIYKHLKNLTEQDVLEYRKKVLGKED